MKTFASCLCLLAASIPAAAQVRDYRFDGGISEVVLRNYLSRAITVADLLAGQGNVDDNIRMLKHIGAKYAGRSLCMWGGESRLPELLVLANRNAGKVHVADPEIVLEACVFEIVSRDVERLAVPAWAFQALVLPVEQRNFRYEEMLYRGGRGRDQWGQGASVPDVSRPETKLWFYDQAVSYIDAGAEAIHFGQVEIMNGNDPHAGALAAGADVGSRIRRQTRGGTWCSATPTCQAAGSWITMGCCWIFTPFPCGSPKCATIRRRAF